MRLKTLLLGGALLFTSLSWAQTSKSDKVIKGRIEKKVLMNDQDLAWFYHGVNEYTPNDKMVDYIKSNRGKYNLVAVIGTWDATSQQLFPKLYKTMILASSEDQMMIFGADQKMQTDAPTDYKLKKVPTFIVMKDGKEEGRIVGETADGVESELAKVLLKMNRKDKGE
jgi:thiol-disulfide isomerase/thioredoxin